MDRARDRSDRARDRSMNSFFLSFHSLSYSSTVRTIVNRGWDGSDGARDRSKN